MDLQHLTAEINRTQLCSVTLCNKKTLTIEAWISSHPSCTTHVSSIFVSSSYSWSSSWFGSKRSPEIYDWCDAWSIQQKENTHTIAISWNQYNKTLYTYSLCTRSLSQLADSNCSISLALEIPPFFHMSCISEVTWHLPEGFSSHTRLNLCSFAPWVVGGSEPLDLLDGAEPDGDGARRLAGGVLVGGSFFSILSIKAFIRAFSWKKKLGTWKTK